MSAGRRGGPRVFRAPHLGGFGPKDGPPPYLILGGMFSFCRPTFRFPRLGARYACA